MRGSPLLTFVRQRNGPECAPNAPFNPLSLVESGGALDGKTFIETGQIRGGAGG